MKTPHETVNCTEYDVIPDFELESIAKIFLPMVQEFYANNEGMAAFEAWRANQEQRSAA